MFFEPILIVLIVIAIGFVFTKLKRFDLDPINDAVLYILLPCLIFSSIVKEEFIVNEFLLIALTAIAVVVIMGFIMHLFLKLIRSERRGLLLPAMFMNSGNMGLPVALFAFGAIGLNKAVLFNTVTGILIYSLGVYVAQQRKDLSGVKEVFKLPLIYAAAIGIILNMTNIALPNILFQPIDLIGMAAIPVILLTLGAKIATIKIGALKLPVATALIRIVGGFVIALVFITLLNIGGITGKVVLLSSSMPPAATTFILSQRYAKDAELVASTVFIGTLMSFISIALILMIL